MAAVSVKTSVVSIITCSYKTFSPVLSIHQLKYTITFFYSGACKGGGGDSGGDQGPPPTLSVGSILLIL